MSIITKAQEWADKYGGILTASAETKFPWLYKGAVGGLEHVISVDNGGAYIELWREGQNGNYYATTGAKLAALPGLSKGAKLDEALDRFFALTAKLQKGKTYRDRAGVRQPPARVRSPFKRARIAKVDPQIGPELSVGHVKPSDLSPESSMKNLSPSKKTRVISKILKRLRKQLSIPKPAGYGRTGMPQYSYESTSYGGFQTPGAARYASRAYSQRSGLRNAAVRNNIVGLSHRGPKSVDASSFHPSRIHAPTKQSRYIETARQHGIEYYAGRTGSHQTPKPRSHTSTSVDSAGERVYVSPEGFSGRAPASSPVGTASGWQRIGSGRFGKGCSPCLQAEVAKAVNAVNKVVATPIGVSKQRGWTKESHKSFWRKISKREPGGHTACVERMRGKVDDPHAFCAWAEHEATGRWPRESA